MTEMKSITAPPGAASAGRVPMRRPKIRGWQISIASVAVGLAAWQVISDHVVANSLFLASPVQVGVALFALAKSGELWKHLETSGLEFLVGYSIAVAIGIGVGLLIATSSFWKSCLQPWISGLYATPTIALGPLFILWFGIGVWSKIVVVVLLVVFTITINTEVGIRSTSERYLEMMRCFGATRRQLFLKVSLPSALPFILAGMRLGIGRGLIGVVVAELFGSRQGIGRLIGASADSFDMPDLFAAVTVLAAAGIGLTSAFVRMEQSLLHWTRD